MGYRNPGYDEIEDPAEFEWDGQRQKWLFYRNGSHAPVVVEEAEKDRCEAIQKWGGLVAALISAAIFIFADDRLAKLYSTPDARELGELTALGIAVVLFVLGNRLVDRLATRRFRDRQPVGPERSPANDELVWLGPNGLAGFVALVLLAGSGAWLHWPTDGVADWIWIGLAAFLALWCLAGIWPSRKPRRL